MARYFIVGGAGFLGSHFCDRLLSDKATGGVTIYDNFSRAGSGTLPSTRPIRASRWCAARSASSRR